MSVEMQLMIADFNTPDGAMNAMKTVKKEKVKRGDFAILSKNEDGKLKIKETDSWDWGIAAGAFAGALVGGFIGVGGAMILGTIGGITVKLIDRGFPNDKLKEMAESLAPHHSMFVMLTDSEAAPKVERILAESGGQLISHSVGADLVADLEKAVESGEVQIQVDADNEKKEDAQG